MDDFQTFMRNEARKIEREIVRGERVDLYGRSVRKDELHKWQRIDGGYRYVG